MPTEHFTKSDPTGLAQMMTTILSGACGANEPDAEGWNTYFVEVHCLVYRIVARNVRDGRVKANTPDGYHYPAMPTPAGMQPDADGWQIREYGVTEI